MGRMGVRKFSKVFVLVAFATMAAVCAAAPTGDHEPIREALQWIRTTPHGVAEYDYVMTARLRLLVFWVGKDDVGGGYIRRGVSAEDGRQEFFQVLFGSDPAKAPRAVNRWGAGTEVSLHKEPMSAAGASGATEKKNDVVASAFFGFMKASRGKSAAEMQAELRKEKDQGEHAFTGIVSRVEPGTAVSLVVPFDSNTDFDLHQYDTAEPLMLAKIADSTAPVKSLHDAGRCASSKEFLATVAELLDRAVSGQHEAAARCYVYDAQENTLGIESATPVSSFPVQLHGPNDTMLLDTTYSDLLQCDFVSTHKLTGKKVYFSILAGTRGNLRGVPVQIRYQPNWWFQVVLNLRPAAEPRKSATVATR